MYKSRVQGELYRKGHSKLVCERVDHDQAERPGCKNPFLEDAKGEM